MPSISRRLKNVQSTIQLSAVNSARRPESITLLAVSKSFSCEEVIEAISAGQYAFGENYLQEALSKIALVNLKTQSSFTNVAPITWHFIGAIQSNKTRAIAENFSWVHTVDREKIAQRLSRQRPPQLSPLNICLQVNITGETSKSGLEPQEVLSTANAIIRLPRLRLRGLMVIPELTNDQQKQRLAFRKTKELLIYLQEKLEAPELNTLSMGMSSDMKVAIEEGSTIVRIGSTIFGKRNRDYEKQPKY